jgi:hypothetical protein
LNNFNKAIFLFLLGLGSIYAKPVVSITGFSPKQYKAGTVITLTGSATDAIDGVLPESNYQWFALYKHNDHYHDGPAFSTGKSTVTFEVPATFDFSADVFFRIVLIVYNSNGETDTSRVDIQPLLSTFAIESDPQGLQFNAFNGSVVSPNTLVGVQNVPWTFVGPSETTIAGEAYLFKKWSDNTFSSAIFFNAPATYTSYLASYVKKSDIYLNASNGNQLLPQSGGESLITISSNFTWTLSTTTGQWIFPDKTTGFDNSTLVLTISPNLTSNTRIENLIFTVAGIVHQITITQSGPNMLGLTSDETSVFKMDLYPNPFHKSLSIKTEQDELPFRIVLSDIYGNLRLSKDIQVTITQLEIENLESGVYYLLISSGNKRVFRTIIKL